MWLARQLLGHCGAHRTRPRLVSSRFDNEVCSARTRHEARTEVNCELAATLDCSYKRRRTNACPSSQFQHVVALPTQLAATTKQGLFPAKKIVKLKSESKLELKSIVRWIRYRPTIAPSRAPAAARLPAPPWIWVEARMPSSRCPNRSHSRSSPSALSVARSCPGHAVCCSCSASIWAGTFSIIIIISSSTIRSTAVRMTYAAPRQIRLA